MVWELKRVNESRIKNNTIPSGLVPYTVKVSQGCKGFDEVVAVREFREYRAELAEKVVMMRHVEMPQSWLLVRRCDSSRYFDRGRWKAKKNIRRRFGKYYSAPGTLFTATYDPKIYSRWEAWERVNKDWSRFKHDVEIRYRRVGRKPPMCIRVIEEQKKTGYPHIHVFYPNLKYLLKKELLQQYWSFGRARVEYAGNVNVGRYVCKYVTKMGGWSEEALAFMWKRKRRMYSYSRCYTLPVEEKLPGEWAYLFSSTKSRINNHIDVILASCQTIINLEEYDEFIEPICKYQRN